MMQTVILNPRDFKRQLPLPQIERLKNLFFLREAVLREEYRDRVSDRNNELFHWMERIRTNHQTPNAVFYFIRWLAEDDWFEPTRQLYEASRSWQARLLCVGSASRWTRDLSGAFELVIRALHDRSIEVVLSAIQGCAYSLSENSIPHLEEIRNRVDFKKSTRHGDVAIAIENTFAAIEYQDHHLFYGLRPNTGFCMWPWDEKTLSLAELDLNWRLSVLTSELGERLAELGAGSLPEYERVVLDEFS